MAPRPSLQSPGKIEGTWQPLAFFSRQLVPRERKYSTFDRELLAVWLAIRHFRFVLEGREFTVFVDHKPLTAIVGAVQLGLDYARMGADQAADRTLQSLKDSDTGLQLGKVAVGASGRAKVHRHTKAPLEPFVVPERRFDHVNIDLVGPLPPSRGFTYLLTMVDRTTRWPEGYYPRLYHVCRCGSGVHWHMGFAFRLTDGNWVDKLPWFMLGLRTAPKEDLQSSSAELVYGQALRVPGDFIPDATRPWSATEQRSSLREVAMGFAPVPRSQHCSPESRMPAGLRSALFVFVRHDAHRGPLRPPHDGPFKVLQHGDKSLVVDIGGRPETISVDRIKPAHVDISRPLVLAQAPRRGRPPVLCPPGQSGVPSTGTVPAASPASLPSAPATCTRSGRAIIPFRSGDFDYG
uniref:Reverse transcriptase RNase H-like domain-containing protein n=1 Tax=Knipowitschia caucasica TaxID=637954 RepID=A0AAV2KH15_KNICA